MPGPRRTLPQLAGAGVAQGRRASYPRSASRVPGAALAVLFLLLTLSATAAGALPSKWKGPYSLVEEDAPLLEYVRLAADRGGNVLALWSHIENFHWQLYSSRYEAGKGWTAPHAVPGLNRTALAAALVVDETGDTYALLQGSESDRGPALSEDTIYLARFHPGTGWDAPRLLDEHQTGNFSDAAVAPLPGGGAIAMWARQEAVGPSIWSAAYRPGSGWEALREPVQYLNGSAGRVALSVAPNGTAFATWWWSANKVSVVHAASASPAGNWSKPTELARDADGYAQRFEPEAAIDGSGNCVFAWAEDGGSGPSRLAIATVAANGSWSAHRVEMPIDRLVSLAGTADLEFLALWDESYLASHLSTIDYVASNDNWTVVTRDLPVNASEFGGGRWVSISSDGTVTAAWEATAPSGDQVIRAASALPGVPWSAAQDLSVAWAFGWSGVALAADGVGTVWVAFIEENPDDVWSSVAVGALTNDQLLDPTRSQFVRPPRPVAPTNPQETFADLYKGIVVHGSEAVGCAAALFMRGPAAGAWSKRARRPRATPGVGPPETAPAPWSADALPPARAKFAMLPGYLFGLLIVRDVMILWYVSGRNYEMDALILGLPVFPGLTYTMPGLSIVGSVLAAGYSFERIPATLGVPGAVLAAMGCLLPGLLGFGIIGIMIAALAGTFLAVQKAFASGRKQPSSPHRQ
jgi:hypothetical protein